MTHAILPAWAEILVSLLLAMGGLLTLVGCLGLWRFTNFYQRLHGPTLGATLGLLSILLASALYFTMTDEGAALHEILIATFLLLTVPATTVMLARASIYRHRRAGEDVPANVAVPKDKPASFPTTFEDEPTDDVSDPSEDLPLEGPPEGPLER